MTNSNDNLGSDPLVYFTPGELIFLIDHDDNVERTAQSLVDRALENALSFAVDAYGNERANRVRQRFARFRSDVSSLNKARPMRVISFAAPASPLPQRSASQGFSIVVVDAFELYQSERSIQTPDPNNPFDSTVPATEDIPEQNPAQTTNGIDPFYQPESIARFGVDIDMFNDLAERIGFVATGDVTLRAVSPNWLTLAYGQDCGGGTPASYPVDAGDQQGDPQKVPARSEDVGKVVIKPAKTQSANNEESAEDTSESTEGSEPVQVFILDTAPPSVELVKAYDDHHAHNHLLNRLLENVSQNEPERFVSDGLTIEYASNAPYGVTSRASRTGATCPVSDDSSEVPGKIIVPGKEDLKKEWHNYDMSDHGLFVAGIIKSMAPPDASIRIIQVMNEYGIGSVCSLAAGFQRVLDQIIAHPGGPAIVNCSFGSAQPLFGHETFGLYSWPIFSLEQHAAASQLDWIRVIIGCAQPGSWESLMCRAALPLETIFALVRNHALIVAAAGNEALRDDEEVNRPLAHYPAAYTSVIGVGAINKAESDASYTNISEWLPDSGFATFGGEVEPPTDKEMTNAKPEEAVLGVYIGNIPVVPRPDPPDETQVGTPTTHGWAWWSGTSFSTAIMSGLLASRVTKANQERVIGNIRKNYPFKSGIAAKIPSDQP